MEWWKKMKRVWVAVSSRVKLRKAGGVGSGRGGGSSGGGGDTDGVASGLLKLREDVLACGYEDVQVMWKMLHGSSPSEKVKVEEFDSHPAELSSPNTPKAISGAWRAFL